MSSASDTVDRWVQRLASDNYPFDTVLRRAYVLAQEHGVDIAETLTRVAELRTPMVTGVGADADEPLRWVPVPKSVSLGDTFDVRCEEQRAYCIHTDERGIRRARIGPRYVYDGVPHVDAVETHDGRRAVQTT